MSFTKKQTSVSKNGLINLAIAKILVDYKVVDYLNENASQKTF